MWASEICRSIHLVFNIHFTQCSRLLWIGVVNYSHILDSAHKHKISSSWTFHFFAGRYRAWCSGSDHNDPGRAASTSSQRISSSWANSSAPSSVLTTITWMKTTMRRPESPQQGRGVGERSCRHSRRSGWVWALTLFRLWHLFQEGSCTLLSLSLGL